MKDALRTFRPSSFSTHKKPPLKGEGPAKRAEGFRSPAPQGRGGSVSRRDHNQVYRKIPPLSGGTNSDESYPAKRQPLFGREGSGGEGLLSEKPPLPPESPVILFRLFGREREGGSFSEEKLPPSQSPSPFLAQIVLCFADLGDSGVAEGRELKGLGLRRKG